MDGTDENECKPLCQRSDLSSDLTKVQRIHKQNNFLDFVTIIK